MRFPSPRVARGIRAFAGLAAVCSIGAGISLMLTGCGSPNRTVAIPTTGPSSTITPAGSRFAGIYTGTWTFTAGLAAGSAPTFGGPMSLTIDSNGSVAAVFTDTLDAGQGSFSAAGTVDEAGDITYVSPSPGLVGARTFSGEATVANSGALTASGTLFFDYPGTSSWSATGQPLHS